MNGAHLASPIRGELGYAQRPHLGSQIHCPIGNQVWDPLGKEDVCPNFALTVGKFVFSNSGNFRAKANPPKPRSCPKRHSGNEWGKIPVLTGIRLLFLPNGMVAAAEDDLLSAVCLKPFMFFVHHSRLFYPVALANVNDLIHSKFPTTFKARQKLYPRVLYRSCTQPPPK